MWHKNSMESGIGRYGSCRIDEFAGLAIPEHESAPQQGTASG